MPRKPKGQFPRLLRTIDQYLAPLIKEAEKYDKLSKQDRYALSLLIYNSFSYLMCLIQKVKDDPGLAEAIPLLERVEHRHSSKEYPAIANPDCINRLKECVRRSNIDRNIKEEILFIAENITEAANILASCNLRLLRKILFNMLSKNPSRVDENIISEGLWALIYSIYCYNPYRGIELSTYIAWWVKSLVGSVLDKKRYESQAQELSWFRNYTSIFGKRRYRKILALKKEPTLADLEEIFGIKLSNYFQALSERPDVVSMSDQTVLETEIEERVPDPKSTESDFMDEDISQSEYSDIVLSLFEDLSEIEKEILELHFGFRDGRSYSTYEIAKKVGRSPEYVRKQLGLLLSIFKSKLSRLGFTEDDL